MNLVCAKLNMILCGRFEMHCKMYENVYPVVQGEKSSKSVDFVRCIL